MDYQLHEQAEQQQLLDARYDKRQMLADKLRNIGYIQSDTEQLTTSDLKEYFDENKAELIPTDYLMSADVHIDDEHEKEFMLQCKLLVKQAAYELVEIKCEDLENWE